LKIFGLSPWSQLFFFFSP